VEAPTSLHGRSRRGTPMLRVVWPWQAGVLCGSHRRCSGQTSPSQQPACAGSRSSQSKQGTPEVSGGRRTWRRQDSPFYGNCAKAGARVQRPACTRAARLYSGTQELFDYVPHSMGGSKKRIRGGVSAVDRGAPTAQASRPGIMPQGGTALHGLSFAEFLSLGNQLSAALFL